MRRTCQSTEGTTRNTFEQRCLVPPVEIGWGGYCLPTDDESLCEIHRLLTAQHRETLAEAAKELEGWENIAEYAASYWVGMDTSKFKECRSAVYCWKQAADHFKRLMEAE